MPDLFTNAVIEHYLNFRRRGANFENGDLTSEIHEA